MSFLGAIGSVAGNVLGSVFDQQINRSNAEHANRFSENMSSTSYQRGVQDLKNAGLNPILAAQFGGASTPTGAMTAPSKTDITGAVSNSTQYSKAKQEISNMQTQNTNIEAQTAQSHSQSELNKMLEKKAQADAIQSVATTAQLAQQTKNLALNNELTSKQLPKAEFDKNFYSSPPGKMMRTIGLTSEEIGGALGGAAAAYGAGKVAKRWAKPTHTASPQHTITIDGKFNSIRDY